MTNKSLGKIVTGIGIGLSILAVSVMMMQVALHGSVINGLKGFVPASLLIVSGNRLMYGPNAASPVDRQKLILGLLLGIVAALVISVGLLMLLM